jgi:hypothetical protein
MVTNRIFYYTSAIISSILNCDPITDTNCIPLPESFRRALVLGTGLSLLLISIITAKNMWDYFIMNTTSFSEFLILIFSAWGITYVIFLWVSFLLIGLKNFKGCAWTAIRLGLKSGDIHICVDSVLNARQDLVQRDYGISIELLKTDGSRLWIVGLIALLIFAYFLTIDYVDFITLPVRLISVGVISSLYYLYDVTIHEFSKSRKDLDGCDDYRELLKKYLRSDGLRNESSFKKS